MNNDNPLIGLTINAIKIAKDRMAILFVTEEGERIARVSADCCSHTWVEHIELPTELPCKVTSAESIELNCDLDSHDGEMSYYGYRIRTNKGDIIIDYRNESNGYYGGSITFNDDDFYGGVYGQNISKNEWMEVEQ